MQINKCHIILLLGLWGLDKTADICIIEAYKTTTTKVNNMIQMNFKNNSGKTNFIICNKAHADAFVWDMNDKGFVWVSTNIL
jgi:hypothetical protein